MSIIDVNDVKMEDIIKGIGAIAALAGAVQGLIMAIRENNAEQPVTQAELDAMFDAVDLINRRIQQRVQSAAQPVE